MKPLYYIESALSVNVEKKQNIPAKKLKWKPTNPKIAWEDAELCNRERIDIQENLFYHIVRVRQAGWLHNIFIRISTWFSDDWVVVKG